MIEIKLKNNQGSIKVDGVEIGGWVSRTEIIADASEGLMHVVFHMMPQEVVLDMVGETDLSYQVIDWPKDGGDDWNPPGGQDWPPPGM